MNSTQSIQRTAIVLCLAASGVAFAQSNPTPRVIEVTATPLYPVSSEYYCCGVNPDADARRVSQVQRQSVIDQMFAARAVFVDEDKPTAYGDSGITRQMVVADLQAARASGEYERLNGEGAAHNAQGRSQGSVALVAVRR